MTYSEMRRLFTTVAQSDGCFMVWSADSATGAALPGGSAAEQHWAVVLVDVWRGQTYEVRDFARLMEHFPALPAASEPGLAANWHAAEALVDGRMGWPDVRLALHAVEQVYPACWLEGIEHGAHGWSCVLAGAPSARPVLSTIADALVDAYVPGDESCRVTALTLEAAKAIAARCASLA